MKLVRCRDHGFDCTFETHGTEEEALKAAGEHVAKTHHIQVSADLVKAVKEKMHDVEDAKP